MESNRRSLGTITLTEMITSSSSSEDESSEGNKSRQPKSRPIPDEITSTGIQIFLCRREYIINELVTSMHKWYL